MRAANAARKGAPFTFDAGWVRSADRTPAQRTGPRHCGSLCFDRALDLARAGGRIIGPGHRFLIAEGNYLLLDQEPWRTWRTCST
jgi:pantothenate kinase